VVSTNASLHAYQCVPEPNQVGVITGKLLVNYELVGRLQTFVELSTDGTHDALHVQQGPQFVIGMHVVVAQAAGKEAFQPTVGAS